MKISNKSFTGDYDSPNLLSIDYETMTSNTDTDLRLILHTNKCFMF